MRGKGETGGGKCVSHHMRITDEQKAAISRILIDVVTETGAEARLTEGRHYRRLKEEIDLSRADFEAAASLTVLTSLALAREVHYTLKMKLGMTVGELYCANAVIPLKHKMAFEILMKAIDWPISLDEICRLL